MPELPEVEALRLSLKPYLIDQKISKVEVLMPKLVTASGTKRGEGSVESANFFESNLKNKTVVGISRRAKNLIVELDDDSVVLIHLKMTGQLVFVPNNKQQQAVSGGHPIDLSQITIPNKHTYITFHFQHGTLYYNDVRQFGYLLYFPSNKNQDVLGHFANLGLEPLSNEFTQSAFIEGMKKKKGVLKAVFLNQEVVVGLGNIYCDEVCFAANVLPTRLVSSLNLSELKKLYAEICRILPLAVGLGGSSISAYLLADGSRGNYAREHKVYNRGGKECLVCGGVLSKITLAGRTTVYCLHCQK